MLAEYNVALATLFAVVALLIRQMATGQFDAGTWRTVLAIENGGLAPFFGAVQTYTWVSR